MFHFDVTFGFISYRLISAQFCSKREGFFRKVLSDAVPPVACWVSIYWCLPLLCCRWKMRVRSWWTVPSSTSAEPRCCGAPPKACHALPPSNTWRRCARRSTLPALSVPWASTHWRSPRCGGRTRRTRSSRGFTSSVATCTDTTTGATTGRSGRAGRAATGSAPCVGPKGRTCRSGWAVSRAFTWTQRPLLTPLIPAATFPRRRRRDSGVRSHSPTARTPSTLPVPSVPSS